MAILGAFDGGDTSRSAPSNQLKEIEIEEASENPAVNHRERGRRI